MDYKYIKSVMGPDMAENMRNDNYINNEVFNYFERIEPRKLDSALRGGVVLGVQPINATNYITIGLIIYLMDRRGKLKCLCVEAEETEDGQEPEIRCDLSKGKKNERKSKRSKKGL